MGHTSNILKNKVPKSFSNDLSPSSIGLIIILSSFSVAFLLCTGICLALWYRKIRGRGKDPSPANLIIHRQTKISKDGKHQPPTISLLFPTVSYSDAGSEPCTPASTLSTTDRLSGRSRLSTPSFTTPIDSPISETTRPPMWNLPLQIYPDNDQDFQNRKRSYSGPQLVHSAPSTSHLVQHPVEPSKNEIRTWSHNIDNRINGSSQSRVSQGLGEVRLRILYNLQNQQLRVIVLSAHGLPQRFHKQEGKIYLKMILSVENKRIRFLSSLVNASSSPTFCSTFKHGESPKILSGATLILSICQEETGGRRVVAGSAALVLQRIGFEEDLEHDLDSGHIILPLKDSSPEQQISCGGDISLGVNWDVNKCCLKIFNIILSNLNIEDLFLQDKSGDIELPWVYLKVCVYVHGSLVCWRRTRPVPLYPDVTPLEDDLQLFLPNSQLIDLNLAFSIRQKTKKKGGRRVLGGVNLGSAAETIDGRIHWQNIISRSPSGIVHKHTLTHM